MFFTISQIWLNFSGLDGVEEVVPVVAPPGMRRTVAVDVAVALDVAIALEVGRGVSAPGERA